MAFLPDVRAKTDSLRIQFLGKEANVPAGMAVFAYQADVPIISGIVTRIGWSHHKIEIMGQIIPDRTRNKQEEWQRMTQAVFTNIESAIRRQPEQWFWYNKRWILDPLESAESKPPEPAVNPPVSEADTTHGLRSTGSPS